MLGLGEAGSRLAADLTAAGAEVRGYDPRERRRARQEAVAGSDVVLSVNSARDAARGGRGRRAPALGRRPSTPT